MRPVLFVTNHVPPDRVGAFAALHEAQGIELALFGGRLHHATAGVEDPGLPFVRIEQRAAHALAASGRHRAVIVSSAGRVALPATVLGARRARLPLIYWSGIWAPVRTPAHVLATPLVRAIERRADAVVTYGSHVSDYLRAHGARNIHVAPQPVDNDFWRAPADPGAARASAGLGRGDDAPLVLYAGRAAPSGKGLAVLLGAWPQVRAARPDARLVLAGVPAEHGDPALGIHALGQLEPAELRNFYGAASVVVVPSIPTRDFREPWGLVVNEAMNSATPVIATDAVGAAAGGLVRDGQTGLVVAAGDGPALAGAIDRLLGDELLRDRLGQAGLREVGAYTFGAWASGFAAALADTGADRTRC